MRGVLGLDATAGFIDPASSSVNEETTKSGVERPPSAMAKGVKPATNIKATSPKGTAGLDRVRTSALGFEEAVDRDRLPLPLPLGHQLIEESIVFGIRNAEAPAFLPQQELFGAS